MSNTKSESNLNLERAKSNNIVKNFKIIVVTTNEYIVNINEIMINSL